MYSGSGTIKIFAGSSGRPFAERMCAYLGTQLGESYSKKFSEGNIYVKIGESIRDKDVYLVQPIGREPNDDMMELCFWIDACKRSSCSTVTVIMPYFSYAKGDKKDEPRVSIRARVCADCIEAAGADRIVCMDLHAAQIQGFFKIPLDHLYAKPLLAEYIKRTGIVDKDLVVVSPDAGSAKRAHDFAKELNCPVAIGDKTRTDHSENAQILGIIGEVKGKNCLVVDDFSISGGTLIDVARGLQEQGAKRIFGALSHNCMTSAAMSRIDESPFEFVLSTDTLESPEAFKHPKLKIISAAPMFAQAVKIIHDKAPMSTLFDKRISKRMLDMSFSKKLSLIGTRQEEE